MEVGAPHLCDHCRSAPCGLRVIPHHSTRLSLYHSGAVDLLTRQRMLGAPFKPCFGWFWA
jgi:hypothetical protein